MISPRFTLPLAALVASTLLATAQEPTPLVTHSEAQLISILQSPDASRKDRADACRELAVIGTPASLPSLVALLPDPEMSHMARYALETLPDPAVDTAFRDALQTLKGPALVGVIGSIGVRRDVAATDRLVELLPDQDPDVAQAAARALGRLATPAAAKALVRALPKTPARNQLAFQEAILRIAEAFADADRTRDAFDLYEALRVLPDSPQQVRAAAVRGIILTSARPKGLELLQNYLLSPYYVLAAAAVRTAQEMAGPEVSEALTTHLERLTYDRQILVIRTLGQRGDAPALPALSKAAESADPNVRLAAIQALAGMREATVIPVLLALMKNPDATVADAAQESLAALPFPAVDDAVVAMLDSQDTAQRLVGFELVGRRRRTAALPTLLTASADPDPKIRAAALRRVGELGGTDQIAPLLGQLAKAEKPGDRDAVEQALTAIASRTEPPTAVSQPVIAALPQAPAPAQPALLRLLGVVGGPAALQTVVAAVENPSPEIHTTALRTLSTWKTDDAAPALLTLAKATSDTTDRTLCLRGYLGWVRSSDLPVARRLAMARDVVPLVNADDDAKLFLGAVGSIRSVDALALAVPRLDNAGTKNEAAAAVATIAEAVLKGPTDKAASATLVEALQKALAAEPEAGLQDRLRKQLPEAESRAG